MVVVKAELLYAEFFHSLLSLDNAKSCKRREILFQKSWLLFSTWREYFYSKPKEFKGLINYFWFNSHYPRTSNQLHQNMQVWPLLLQNYKKNSICCTFYEWYDVLHSPHFWYDIVKEALHLLYSEYLLVQYALYLYDRLLA